MADQIYTYNNGKPVTGKHLGDRNGVDTNILSGAGTYSIGFGEVPGKSNNTIAGFNAGITTSWQVLRDQGGAYDLPTTAQSYEIVSSSADDTAAGSGAQVVLATLIDGDFVESNVLITLNGTTPVAIAGTWRNVQFAIVWTAGSDTVNAGTIDIRVVTANTVIARMAIGKCQDFNTTYIVPALRQMSIIGLDMFAPKGVDLQYKAMARLPHVGSALINTFQAHAYQTPSHTPLLTPATFGPGTQLWIEVKAGQNTEASGLYYTILKEEES